MKLNVKVSPDGIARGQVMGLLKSGGLIVLEVSVCSVNCTFLDCETFYVPVWHFVLMVVATVPLHCSISSVLGKILSYYWSESRSVT